MGFWIIVSLLFQSVHFSTECSDQSLTIISKIPDDVCKPFGCRKPGSVTSILQFEMDIFQNCKPVSNLNFQFDPQSLCRIYSYDLGIKIFHVSMSFSWGDSAFSVVQGLQFMTTKMQCTLTKKSCILQVPWWGGGFKNQKIDRLRHYSIKLFATQVIL